MLTKLYVSPCVIYALSCAHALVYTTGNSSGSGVGDIRKLKKEGTYISDTHASSLEIINRHNDCCDGGLEIN